jgi:hypothetical protein
VQHLALEVANVDDVEIDETERADTRRGEIERRGRAEPAGADEQHARRFDTPLPLELDAGKDEMPVVPAKLVARESR